MIPRRSFGETLDGVLDRSFAFVRRLDPAPRPEPLGPLFLVCFALAVVGTSWLLVVNKYLPGQDIPYHAFCSRVWLDAGVPGTPYALYEPRHVLEANTLLYGVAALLSIFFKSFTAYRIAYGYYLVGLPFACLYALRSFGRSPWGSLLAFPLCYVEAFIGGYANMTFAAPTFVIALVEYRRFVLAPTWKRGLVVAVLLVAVFLSHAHVYLWLGALLLLYSFAVLVTRTLQVIAGTPGNDLRALLVTIGGALAVAVPSLLVFQRWYARGYGAGNSVGGTGNNVAFTKALSYLPFGQKFSAGSVQGFFINGDPYETAWLLGLLVVFVLSLTMARAGRDRTAPLPELAVILSVLSYFVLPDDIAGQVVAVRQFDFVFWLLPIAVVPVSFRVSKLRSVVVVVAILGWSVGRMSFIGNHLLRFTKDEMVGFDRIVAAAPATPGLRVAYVSVNARSINWNASPMFHSYGFLDAQRSYDGPLEFSNRNSIAAVRYAEGPPLPLKHLYNNPNWAADADVWKYDLVLVSRWSPTAAQRAEALKHGSLVAAAGNWQLWQRSGDAPP